MIALYPRVSTDEQREHGFSIDNQKERLEAFCKSQGWADYRFYVDDGYSGTNMERPALKRMIRDVKEGKIDTVVVYKLDRLSRKQKDVLYLLEDVFDANGVAFKSATEPFDTATPLGKAMLGILAVFAQLERDTIVERATAGRRQRIRRGIWPGGREPFGYSWNVETQTLEVIPEQAELVRQAFSMYLKGHSRLSIAEWLTDRSNDRVFDHAVVRDMLARPIYTGRMNNAGVLVDGKHDAIIDTQTFERVQAETKKRNEGRAPIGDYFLSGILRCGVCGGPVYHFTMSGKYTYEYYACRNQHVRKKERTNNCSLGYIRQEKLDARVAARIKQFALNPQDVVDELTRRNDQVDQSSMVETLESELKQIDEKLERWYDAFESGTLDPARLSARIDKLEGEKKTILLRLSEIDDTPTDNKADVIDTLVTIGESWDAMTYDEQKTVLRLAVDHVIVYPKGEFELVWNV